MPSGSCCALFFFEEAGWCYAEKGEGVLPIDWLLLTAAEGGTLRLGCDAVMLLEFDV